jgi:Zn finger protein HypA/HybF involved in hydrogenase expression
MNRVEVTCDNCKEEYDFIDESKLESYYFYCPNCGEESEIDNATPSSTVER